MKRIKIGLVGQIRAGKQEVVNYLKKKGFLYFSLSDEVREEVRRRDIKKFSRKDLQDIGDDLRKRFGVDVLARRIYKKLLKQENRGMVVDSIRNPAEVRFLRRRGNFFLVGVKALRRIRYGRVLKAVREGDGKLIRWEEFLKVDRRDWGVGQKNFGQQVGKTMAEADFVIRNNKGLDELCAQIEAILVKIYKKALKMKEK